MMMTTGNFLVIMAAMVACTKGAAFQAVNRKCNASRASMQSSTQQDLTQKEFGVAKAAAVRPSSVLSSSLMSLDSYAARSSDSCIADSAETHICSWDMHIKFKEELTRLVGSIWHPNTCQQPEVVSWYGRGPAFWHGMGMVVGNTLAC